MPTTNPESRSCRACGKPVPKDAPFGHCPACLVALGFGPLPEEGAASSLSSPGSPRRLGEYELLEQIGRGGMGIVYKARQLSLKRMVALKMLGPHASAFPGIAERLRLEAEVAGSLSHPQIVTIYDVGEHEGQPFFTMELIEGTGLDKLIGPDGFRHETGLPDPSAKKNGAEAHAASVMIQIARAVDYAHKHGVLHRDLKPANILVDAQGETHLTDFGLAKALGRIATAGTASGAIMGTPAYMAPEQAVGATKHASTAADIYSLGAIFYEMLTGRQPFRSETPLETLRRVVEEAPKPPSTFNRNLDADLAIICLKCLEKDPQHRYSSAEALADDLERWLRGEPIEARSVRPLERVWRWCRREPVLAGLMGGSFFLLAAVAVLGLALYQRESARLTLIERSKAEYHQRLTDRIAKGDREGQTFIEISAEELRTLIERQPGGPSAESRALLGLHANLRQPDQFLYNWQQLLNYFLTNRQAAGLPVEFDLRVYPARSNVIAGLSRKEVDVMRVDPAVFVAARATTPLTNILARERFRGGSSGNAAVLFVRADSGIESFAQLKGRSFAFGEQGSALGDFLARAELVNQGLRARDFLRVTNFYNDAVMAAVGSGDWDAGVAPLEHVAAVPGGRFKILKQLHIPGHVWALARPVNPAVAKTIQSSLLSLADDRLLAPLDPMLSGFEPARPSDYDALERAMEKSKQFDQPAGQQR